MFHSSINVIDVYSLLPQNIFVRFLNIQYCMVASLAQHVFQNVLAHEPFLDIVQLLQIAADVDLTISLVQGFPTGRLLSSSPRAESKALPVPPIVLLTTKMQASLSPSSSNPIVHDNAHLQNSK